MSDIVAKRRRRGRPPASDGEATRRNVLEAAVQCFAETGYAGTTLRAIAEEVGLTPGSLYHHFSSKQALFAAAYEYALDVIFLSYEEAALGHSSLRSELLAVLERARWVMAERPAVAALVLRAEVERLELPAPDAGPYRRFVRGLVSRAVARGEVSEEDAPVLDRTFGALLWGLSLARGERGRALTLEGYRRLIEGSFVREPKRRRRPVGSAGIGSSAE